MDSDAELLHAFLELDSQEAFTVLVRRHLPMVYGAALRRVGGDTHRAQDIAQIVFTALARKGAALRSHPALAGWLYTATQHAAMKSIRTENRRERREAAAGAIATDDVPWEGIRPVIDDALLDLAERDRLVVLLRFFQEETFAAIGARLGMTDGGARMRTEQALESLRAALAKRGVTSTGAALAGALAAHGAVIAPGGMAAAIAANAAAASAGGLLFLMSTSTFKTGAVVVALAAAATGLFLQNRANGELRAEVASLRTDLAARGKQSLDNFRSAKSVAQGDQSELEGLRAEVARLSALPPPNDAMAAWALRLASLKQRMSDHPEQNIPEMRFLTEEDWLDASKPKLETEEDYRKAMASLRGTAERIFGQNYLQPALKKFSQANNDFPTDLAQLRPYLDDAVGPDILQRWDVMPANAVSNLRMGGDRMVSEKAPVDAGYDTRRVFGLASSGGTNWSSRLTLDNAPPAVQSVLAPVISAYKSANGGQSPSSAAQLTPFAATPEQAAMVQEMTKAQSGAGGSASVGR